MNRMHLNKISNYNIFQKFISSLYYSIACIHYVLYFRDQQKKWLNFACFIQIIIQQIKLFIFYKFEIIII